MFHWELWDGREGVFVMISAQLPLITLWVYFYVLVAMVTYMILRVILVL